MRRLFPRGERRASARTRRGFLRLAGTGLLGGLVTRLDREARGAVIPQRRHILYNHGNGLQSVHLAKSAVTASGFTLGSFMRAFAGLEPALTVVENLYCTPGRGQHGNSSSALSCTKRGTILDFGTGIGTVVLGGPTIDQVIADAIRGQARLRSLVLGHPFLQSKGNCVQGTIVGRGPNEPVFPVLDAVKAHELVFGVRNPNKVLVELQASYLDFVKNDVKAFQDELPAAEKQKLEQYLESVREVERSLVQVSTGECGVVPSQAFKAPTRNDPVFWRYMCDLAVAGLQCGATNQVTLLHTYGCVHHSYTFDGVSRNHHGDVAHTDEQGAFMERILGFHAEQVAYIYRKLKAVPEGGGTMADGLLMTWMSDGGGRHHNGTRMHPVVFLGRAGGRVRGGVWKRYAAETQPLAAAHLTAARAMGMDLQTFGDGTDTCKAPLAEVLS